MAGDDRCRGMLPHALDGDAFLAAHRYRPGRRHVHRFGRSRGGRLHVLTGDDPVWPGPGQRGQIDPKILGQLPHWWLSRRPDLCPYTVPARRSCGSRRFCRYLASPGTTPRSLLLARSPGSSPQLDPVPHQHGLPLNLGRRAPLNPGFPRRLLGRRRNKTRSRAAALPTAADNRSRFRAGRW